MIQPRRITAVLACHGRSATTREGLGALFAQRLPEGLTLGAVLVDDGSPDDTPDMVARDFPQVRLLRQKGDLWWAGAMRLGLAEAAREAPDFLLWLNDDVRLDPDALARLLACHDQAVRAAPADGHPPLTIGSTRCPERGVPTYGGQRRHGTRPFRFLPVLPAAEAQSCDTFQGNIVLVPLEAHRILGGIAANFTGVQGMADTDFGLRARAAGFPLLLAPGTFGTCPANLRPADWTNPALPFARRIAGLFGPRGFPARGWIPFARRHGGPFWPVWALSPVLRGLTSAVRPPKRTGSPAVPRIALMDGLILAYRLPVLAALAKVPGWDITAFYGPAPAAFSAGAVTEPLPIPVRHVRHRLWPDGKRMAWTGGTWSALMGSHDVAVLEFCVHNLGVWALWLARQLIGRPRIVLSGHFRLADPRRGPFHALRAWLRLRLAKGADALLPYMPSGREECLAHGLAEDRIFVSHNTIDVEASRAAAAKVGAGDLDALRRQLDLPDGPVFLFVGRLYAEKRVDMAIEAMTLLRRQGRTATLLIVGEGPDRPSIERAAAGNPAVRLLPGVSDEDKLAPLFRLASALVCPGSVGLVISHAFAFGIPLVACRDLAHGVEIDYLRPDDNGVLVESPSAQALADALAGLLDQPGRLERLRAGASRSADPMSIGNVVAANIAAYRRALTDMPGMPHR